MRGRVVGNGAERVECELSIGAVSSTFDDLHGPVQERTDPFRLSDSVLLAGRQGGPCGALPHSVQECERDHGLLLGRDERRLIGAPLPEGRQRHRYCRSRQH